MSRRRKSDPPQGRRPNRAGRSPSAEGSSARDSSAQGAPPPSPSTRAPRVGRRVPWVFLLVVAAGIAAMALRGRFGARSGPDPAESGSELDAEVRRILERQIALTARNPSAANHGELGLVYEANQIWPEAERCFRLAAELEPTNPLWKLHQAIVTRSLGDSGAALGLLREVVGEAPDSAAAHYRLADGLLEARDVEGAIRHFRDAVRLAPARPEGHAGLGSALLEAEDHAGAEPVLRRALEIDPTYQSAHYLLGLAYRGLGRKEEATRELALGVGGNRRPLPDPLEANLARYRVDYATRVDGAVDLIEAGRVEDGIRVLEDLRATRPDDLNVLNNLSVAYKMRGNRAKALELLQHALAIDPKPFATWINLASVELELGRLDEALQHIDRAIELAGMVGKAHLVRGLILTQKGRLAEAQAALEASVRFDAGDPEAHYSLGRVCLMTGRFDDARKSLETTVRIAPAHLVATVELCGLYLRLGLEGDAQRALAAARRIAPDDPAVRALAGEVAKRSGQ